MEGFKFFSVWEIIRDIVLPHIGRVIFNSVLFTFIGILVAAFVLFLMNKLKMLTRIRKAYSIIVKLIYIPFVLIITIGLFANIGFVRGVYKIFSIEKSRIVDGIYNLTFEKIYSTEQEKNEFVQKLKNEVKNADNVNQQFVEFMKNTMNVKDTFDCKELSCIIVKKYQNEVYNAVLYGLCFSVGIRFDEKLNYSDFDNAIDKLMNTDIAKIKESVIYALNFKFQRVMDIKFLFYIIVRFFGWFLLMLIPVFEFLIYKIWLEKRLKK